MMSDELAEKVLTVCQEAGERIRGIGDEQYSKSYLLGGKVTQRTEVETLDQHLDGLEEELLDTINHAAMTVLKLRGMRDAQAYRTSP